MSGKKKNKVFNKGVDIVRNRWNKNIDKAEQGIKMLLKAEGCSIETDNLLHDLKWHKKNKNKKKK